MRACVHISPVLAAVPPSSACERGHACAACAHISPELAAVPPSSACERGHACAACAHISPALAAVPPSSACERGHACVHVCTSHLRLLPRHLRARVSVDMRACMCAHLT